MRQTPLLPNKYAFSFEGFHRFTWPERIKILLGWNAKTVSRAMVDRRNASVRAGTQLFLTDALRAPDQVRADIESEVATPTAP